MTTGSADSADFMHREITHVHGVFVKIKINVYPLDTNIPNNPAMRTFTPALILKHSYEVY